MSWVPDNINLLVNGGRFPNEVPPLNEDPDEEPDYLDPAFIVIDLPELEDDF